MSNRPKPLILLILDGFGVSATRQDNAILQANTPCWDQLQKDWPLTTLNCSGEVVGLPDQQMGNSEVGHIHIGTGRFVPQDLSRVNIAIRDGSFFSNTALCRAVDAAVQKNKALHLFGLLSPGGVHSHVGQILAMLELAAQRGLKKIYLHAFLDGRDVPPKSATDAIRQVEEKCAELGAGRIVTLIGRFYAMDRDNRWDRVQKAYDMIVKGVADYQAESALQGLEAAYQRDETDEFVAATSILGGQEAVRLDDEDSVVFMNFRADRARELCRALREPDFNEFERDHAPHQGCFATLTEYHKDFDFPVAFPAMTLKNGLGETLSNYGLTQLRLAETEKYAHVTFFLNGGRDEPFPGEERILVPSPKVRTYDMQPEMSAEEVTGHLLNAIVEQKFDVIICNYANCDMVGHTGKWGPALRAVETIDSALQRIVDALLKAGGQMLVTADHGNIEEMVNEATGQPNTAHTTNVVPLLHVGGQHKLKEGGSLSDIAPTMLAILNKQQPVDMTGRSLIEVV